MGKRNLSKNVTMLLKFNGGQKKLICKHSKDHIIIIHKINLIELIFMNNTTKPEFYFDCPEIKLKPQNQIPKLDDSDRTFIKIPLDYNNNSNIEFRKYLKEMDQYFGSNEFRERIHQRSYYEYLPAKKRPRAKGIIGTSTTNIIS